MTEQAFTSLLVANRGEIALRVMKTARANGLRCIAIYTDADRGAPHVAFADEAVRIGSGPVGDSYLSIPTVIEAAKSSGAEALHPGYGFLSENTEFARACADQGIVFIGPPAAAVELMGNKAAAKTRMIAAGVPCVPGYEGADQSPQTLAVEAEKIGYPLMIKAAAGGGGRGMRMVEVKAGFAAALALAKTEALNAFGSEEMILEKAVIRPRHVEIQVFADKHGHVVHLGERDCSVQRRHQKVVEEAPCPILTPQMREEMGNAAIAAARAIDYVGAGTVEFLLDEAGAFYFLEMNTRLQVEHPVTEMITGRDLVQLQLDVAAGLPLGFDQQDVTYSGHAIEVRLYAEDPLADFLPATGRVQQWDRSDTPGIRVDAGVSVGQEISSFYDPMMAKIIAHAPSRQEARKKLIAALADAPLLGVANNRDFLIDVLSKPDFAKGEATTAFIAENYGIDIAKALGEGGAARAVLAGMTYLFMRDEMAAQIWAMSSELLNWSSGLALATPLALSFGAMSETYHITPKGPDHLHIRLGAETFELTGSGESLRLDGQKVSLKAFVVTGEEVFLATDKRTLSAKIIRPGANTAADKSDGQIYAPMHGNLQAIHVKIGQEVTPGMAVAVLEAMKMQHEIRAEVGGIVVAINHSPPAQVQAGDLLVEIKTTEGDVQ